MVHAQIQTDSQPINNISGKRIFPMEGEKDIISSTEENIYEKSNMQYKLKTSYFINTSSHKHPLEIIRRYISNWFCDICASKSEQNTPSYHCTLCDFDLCIKCAKK